MIPITSLLLTTLSHAFVFSFVNKYHAFFSFHAAFFLSFAFDYGAI
ncbi:exported hypothetical protein [Photobacterium kishitanii]|nr:exported hypothetical protein [Photobacterium kishitanii]